MNTYKKKNSCCSFFFFIIFNEIFFINEQESFPEGLKIDSKNKKSPLHLEIILI